MNTRSALLFLIAILAAGPASYACDVTDVVVEPENPTSQDAVYLLLSGRSGDLDPVVRKVEVTKQSIDVLLQCVHTNTSAVGDWQERVYVGRVAAGTYNLTAGARHNRFATMLTVRDEPFSIAPTSGPEHTHIVLERLLIEDGMAVTFGGVAAPVEIITSEATQRKTAVTSAPRGGTGTVDVVVTYAGGETLTLRDGFRYTASEQEIDYERVMFPVTYAGEGAHGAVWDTEIVVRNDAPVIVETLPVLNPAFPTILPLPAPVVLPPGGKARVGTHRHGYGAFLRIPKGLEKYLVYSAHALDRSRSATDGGTEIPVVRASDTAAEIRLVNIPIGSDFRVMVRVYDFDTIERRVVVQVSVDGGTTHRLPLMLDGAIHCFTEPCLQPSPASAALDLSSIDGLPENGTIDVTLISADGDSPRLWGFATVTHNETQFVTTYTPQHRTTGDF